MLGPPLPFVLAVVVSLLVVLDVAANVGLAHASSVVIHVLLVAAHRFTGQVVAHLALLRLEGMLSWREPGIVLNQHLLIGTHDERFLVVGEELKLGFCFHGRGRGVEGRRRRAPVLRTSSDSRILRHRALLKADLDASLLGRT